MRHTNSLVVYWIDKLQISSRVPLTLKPDGETEAALRGWVVRVATDLPWQHTQEGEPQNANLCIMQMK